MVQWGRDLYLCIWPIYSRFSHASGGSLALGILLLPQTCNYLGLPSNLRPRGGEVAFQCNAMSRLASVRPRNRRCCLYRSPPISSVQWRSVNLGSAGRSHPRTRPRQDRTLAQKCWSVPQLQTEWRNDPSSELQRRQVGDCIAPIFQRQRRV